MIRRKELEEKGHNTPVKWINQEKNTILTKRKDGLKRATSQCHRKKRKNGWNERKETRSCKITLSTNARAELLDYQQRKDKLDVGL